MFTSKYVQLDGDASSIFFPILSCFTETPPPVCIVLMNASINEMIPFITLTIVPHNLNVLQLLLQYIWISFIVMIWSKNVPKVKYIPNLLIFNVKCCDRLQFTEIPASRIVLTFQQYGS